MQTSFFYHPLTLPGASISTKLHHRNRPIKTMMAWKREGSSGKMVDEDMITLRERLRKMKFEMECEGDDHRLPDDWMQWEKSYIYSGGYHSDVYEAVAVLHRFLIDCRPSVVVGLVAVFAVGGSTTVVMVLQWLMNWISKDDWQSYFSFLC
ncbi:hypothetical protein QVD17_29238 [Tagetes erecta]|uniref:Uncharacterized protein n=1 Tax=Tagetes erecta TaxID=13708 RepID=A0AAD8NSS6_TARER|nr:hypothetical protein QVD17_29238 [Tagetes erecta]